MNETSENDAGSTDDINLSILDGVDHSSRTVETALMQTCPGAVPMSQARRWLELAEQMVAQTSAEAPAGCDTQHWADTRRSAVRDVQAAKGWMDRAVSQSGEQRLADRLQEMGWQGEKDDQPAWTAMEQSARAILQCHELSELAQQD